MIGAGYVGLVAGTGLSENGHNVICIDKKQDIIDSLNRGEVPIYERGLNESIIRNAGRERLKFSTDLEMGVSTSEVIFLALPTPPRPDGSADLSALNNVAAKIALCMNEYKIIAIKSTVPVGTAKAIKAMIIENLKKPVDFDIVSNPEFLRQGSAVEDFNNPSRIILGSDSESALKIMREIYKPLGKPIIRTTHETAEIIKYAANTFLAMKISFINEIAGLCENVGGDVLQVIRALGMDKRIGSEFLQPGPGFGGSCFPKDVSSILNIAEEYSFDFKLARAVIEVNERQKEQVVTRSRKILGEIIGENITLLGLSFKPNTDDIRESPAIYVAERLVEEEAVVKAYDPAAMPKAKKKLPGIKYHDSSYDACIDADLVIIMTEWNEFKEMDFRRLKEIVRTPNILDTRNIWDESRLKEHGFNYCSTGRVFDKIRPVRAE
jgi:UDPglucose 6-dehydrogenase